MSYVTITYVHKYYLKRNFYSRKKAPSLLFSFLLIWYDSILFYFATVIIAYIEVKNTVLGKVRFEKWGKNVIAIFLKNLYIACV